MTKTTTGASFDSVDTRDACNKAIEFEIVHPVSRLGIGIFFSVLGKDSDIYRSRISAMADENLRRQNAGLPGPTSLSKLEAKNIDTLVAVTTGWRGDKPGLVMLRGEELAFTAENVRRVLTDLPTVREQVQEQVNNLGNWLGD